MQYDQGYMAMRSLFVTGTPGSLNMLRDMVQFMWQANLYGVAKFHRLSGRIP